MKKKHVLDFYESSNEVESTFNTILLFGKNVSTYKFALCSTLLKNNSKSFITYDELTNDFVTELYNHYRKNPHQFTRQKNSLTKSFDEFNVNQNWEDVIKVARKNIFNDVLDRFHNVGGSSIKDEHLLYLHDKKGKRLVLHDNLNSILEHEVKKQEIEKINQSRWAIVEEAWKSKLSPNLLVFDKNKGVFFSETINERKNLRSAINVLVPYQNNRCFYCNRVLNINAQSDDDNFPDVDHVLPHSYFKEIPIDSNGVWNLVISCKDCNRGSSGKSDSPPSQYFFNKLINRNVLFSEEHRHSLKNSILLSLNLKTNESKKIPSQMNKIYNELNISIINSWKPKIIYS